MRRFARALSGSRCRGCSVRCCSPAGNLQASILAFPTRSCRGAHSQLHAFTKYHAALAEHALHLRSSPRSLGSSWRWSAVLRSALPLSAAWPTVYSGVYPLPCGIQCNSAAGCCFPLFVLWCGIGALPAILTAFSLAFFPIVVNVATGLSDDRAGDGRCRACAWCAAPMRFY